MFLVLTALVWLVPLLWAVYTSLRSYADTSAHGYLSLAHGLTFANYGNAWSQSDLPSYMRTIPREIGEAALVDGASVWRQFWQIILPLCRPAFAALATLESICYNDFFWALVLFETGRKRPITSALANLQGQFFTNQNLIAAGR